MWSCAGGRWSPRRAFTPGMLWTPNTASVTCGPGASIWWSASSAMCRGRRATWTSRTGSTPRPAMAAGTAPITARATPRITTMPRSGPPTAGCLPPWASTLAPTALSPMWSWGAWATGASGTSRPGRGWSPCPARPSGTNTSRTMRPRSPRQSCSCGGHSTSRRPTAWASTTI